VEGFLCALLLFFLFGHHEIGSSPPPLFSKSAVVATRDGYNRCPSPDKGNYSFDLRTTCWPPSEARFWERPPRCHALPVHLPNLLVTTAFFQFFSGAFSVLWPFYEFFCTLDVRRFFFFLFSDIFLLEKNKELVAKQAVPDFLRFLPMPIAFVIHLISLLGVRVLFCPPQSPFPWLGRARDALEVGTASSSAFFFSLPTVHFTDATYLPFCIFSQIPRHAIRPSL